MTKKIFLTLLPLTLLAVPNVPKNLHLKPTKTTVLVSWQDQSSDETGFKIFRDNKLIYTTKENVQTFMDKGLEPETTYHYEVKATDDEQVDYLHVPKKIYKDQPIVAYLNNLSGGDKDWVGIFPDQRIATYKGIDRKHLLAWSYTGHVDTGKGEVAVDKLMAEKLSAGDYEARLFFDDSYDTVAKVYFTIVDENPPLQVSIDDTIKVSYQNTAGNDKDWFAIYEVGTNNEWENVLRWDYTHKKINSESSFGLLNDGEYEVRMFYNNSFVPESIIRFTVGEEIEGTHLEATCDGNYNDTAAIQGALNNYENWENNTLIFPQNKICRANGLTLSLEGSPDTHYKIIGNNSTIKALNDTEVKRDMNLKSWILWIENNNYIDIKDLKFDGNRAKRYTIDKDDNKIPMLRDLKTDISYKNYKHYQNYYNANIVITDSSNIELNNITSTDAVSDNIYIGLKYSKNNKTDNKNIRLINCNLSYAFRNNLSLSNCNNCTIKGGSYNYASGVSPEAGIDFEIDNYKKYKGEHALKNITVENANISENNGAAISSAFYGNPQEIYIYNNTMNNNRKSNRYCRWYSNKKERYFNNIFGMAMNIGFKDSKIIGNSFTDYTMKLAGSDEEPECNSLLYFPSTGKIDGNVIIQDNIFKNLDNFKAKNKPYFYIHSDNGGGHNITGNTFINVDYSSEENYYYDGHKNDDNKSTINNGDFQ